MSVKPKTGEASVRVTPSEAGRLDKFLVERYPDLSRTYLQRLINNRNIEVDGHPVSPHHQLRSGQTIRIRWPSYKKIYPAESMAELPFPVLFEDDHLMVVNKPPNLLSHPAGWKREGSTLIELLAPRLKSREWPDDVKPGLVHRLDRDTSGVMIFAKTPEVHAHLSRQFANRHVKKTYLALVQGAIKPNEGTLECRMARDPRKRQRFAVTDVGRVAITKFKVLERFGSRATFVELSPLTGRTHQLRVQLSTFSHPILGDHVYGGQAKDFSPITRQMLHAFRIRFTHPKLEKEMDFEAPLPDDFQQGLKLLRSPS